MIGTWKLAGIAVLGVAVAYAGGRWQGYYSGKAAGYAKKTQEIADATGRVNKENSSLEATAVDAIQADQDRQGRVRVINNKKMQCIVTKVYAQRFEKR